MVAIAMIATFLYGDVFEIVLSSSSCAGITTIADSIPIPNMMYVSIWNLLMCV